MAFAAFAFVVLLGTVFPLIAEALSGDRLSVGGPYFERMTMPIGFTLLFLMAVAPALPWRRTSTEVLHRRLMWPAWAGTLTVVACVVSGIRGFGPLMAFGLAAFAGAAAIRQLIVSVRATRAQGVSWGRGLIGRSNGGMIVHLGVVIIAVGFAASSSFGQSRQFRLAPGQSATLAGHTVTYLGSEIVEEPNKRTFKARVRVDGGKVYAPSLHQFPFASQAIGSPSVRSGPFDDVYLTLVAAPDSGPDATDATAVIGVNIQPLVAWLWMGGSVMAFGTLLAAWPRDRRRRRSLSEARPAGRDARRGRAVGGRGRRGQAGAGRGSGMSRRAVWLVMAVVLVGALAVGSQRKGPVTDEARVRRIGSDLRCPTCQGMAVADSDAPAARGIQEEIRRRVVEGRETDGQIKDFILSLYPDISLRPETRGLGLVVWGLPVVVGAAVVAGLTVVLGRRRRRIGPEVSDDDRRLVEDALRAPSPDTGAR